MTCLIKNCHIISPDLDLIGASIEIEGKFIKRIYKKGESLPDSENIYDAEYKMAMPGFIDLHFHGLQGFDVCDGNVISIKNIAKGKLAEGVTTIAPTTLTLPFDRLEKVMESIAIYSEETAYSKIAGVHIEGPYINHKCLGAQNPDYIRNPDIKEVRNLKRIADIAIVSFAIELTGGINFIHELREAGIVPSCAHSAANYAQFKEAKGAGLRHMTHFCNQMTKLHHRDIGLVGAGLLDDEVFIEIICDTIHLCPEMISLIFKVKPIGKIILITDSIAASWLDDGIFNMGGLEVIVKNNIARLLSNGALAGSILRYNTSLKNVYEITGLPLSQLVKTTSYNQAKAIGLHKTGKLEVGYYADITIMNDDFIPKIIFINGKCFDL